MRSTVLVMLALWASTVSTYAQSDTGAGVAASFEQLQVLVRPGNTVTVTDAAGSEVSGRIEGLTPSVLSLDLRGALRDFNEADVTAIRQRRNDPLANGARWGLGIGVGFALLAIASCRECDWGSAPGFAAVIVAGYGAMGAGLGVGIDALIRREQTIYRRPRLNVSFRFRPEA